MSSPSNQPIRQLEDVNRFIIELKASGESHIYNCDVEDLVAGIAQRFESAHFFFAALTTEIQENT